MPSPRDGRGRGGASGDGRRLQRVDRPGHPVRPGRQGRSPSRHPPPKSNWALALDEPPYFAFPVTCGITFTFGGLRADENGRVQDRDGASMPGLFVCGEMLGGLFSGNYPGGTGLTAGAVFGRRAGALA
ncbi:FAD-binding protein [Blastococcus brunescens]|uniref:FAD-binding protein n=1 Tax=Blastococcus brunescens TaxID=1564165 RepID=A0ABZ1AYI1_9ACTN|nr:FAD-binding protein [Blastococcus sp. BMG 8361]WRL63626.1 FAD-binding protein [Blastococcus sp. BMG 8361]